MTTRGVLLFDGWYMKNAENYNLLKRPTRDINDGLLFEVDPDWREHWWGMPQFEMGDAKPQYRITINFMALEDVYEFAKKLGLSLGAKSDTAWYPQQKLDEPKEWEYV